jgi:hypothetical protein
MLIKKLVLHRYKRISLSNIETMTYIPEEHLQLILGSNASGKSSTLYMLNPLPADLKKDFYEGGYKHIIIEHNNKVYDISSGMLYSGKHSFIVDGTELNTAGIKKIQLELVKEHFKLTPHINEILLGNVKFTGMSLSDRKKWLTEISNIDYTYPISVFNKLKQRHRDLIGGIRLTQNKILQEDIKIIDVATRNKLTYDLDMLGKFVNHLLTIKTIDNDNIDFESMKKLKDTNNKARLLFSNVSDDSIAVNIDPNVRLSLINEKMDSNNRLISEYKSDLEKISNATVSSGLLVKLTYEKKEIADKIAILRNMNVGGIDLDNITAIHNVFISNYTDMVGLLGELSNYGDIQYTIGKQEELSLYINKQQDEYDRLNRLNLRFVAEHDKLMEYEKEQQITCVNCNHSWHLNFDKNKFDKLKTTIGEYDLKLDNISKDIQRAKDEHDRYISKKAIIDSIRKVFSGNSIIVPVWKDIFIKYNLQSETKLILTELDKLSILLSKLSEYTDLNNNLLKVENRLELINNAMSIKQDLANDNKADIEVKLSSLVSANNQLLIEKDKVVKYISVINDITDINNDLKTNIKNAKKHVDYEVNKMRNAALNELINMFKYEISTIEKKLHDSEVIVNKINDTKQTLESLQASEKVVKLLVKELSPTEGLIAKSINSFLNLFIDDINSVIDTVWTYSLKLQPCSVGVDNDLDYRFPVKINDNEEIDDISKGSSGLKEIIDLAFKVVFIKYLGLEDFPLYLDEYAITMDYTHRINAYSAIDKVLSPNFSQVFIISHFESIYGSMRNCDISIINPDNLMIDSNLEYNKVMKLQ